MQCADAEALLCLLLEGALDEWDAGALRWHLIVCGECRAFVAGIVLTQAIGGIVRSAWGRERGKSEMTKRAWLK